MWSYSCVWDEKWINFIFFPNGCLVVPTHLLLTDRLSAGLIFNSFTEQPCGRGGREGAGSRAGMIFPRKNSPALADHGPPSISWSGCWSIARGWDTEMSFGALARRNITNIRGMRAPLS